MDPHNVEILEVSSLIGAVREIQTVPKMHTRVMEQPGQR